ncbi:hypothetical protein V6N13_054442 [Hibiscus sabdariffa]
MLANLKSTTLFGRNSISWAVFFVVSIWLIWKCRNDAILNSDPGSSDNTLSQCLVWACHVFRSYVDTALPPANSSHSYVARDLCQRHPTSIGWVTLNTYGVVASSGYGLVDGMIRDVKWTWIVGFSRSNGKIDALQANL